MTCRRKQYTPCFVYSANAILGRYKAYDRAFGDLPHRVCYAVKANHNLGILTMLSRAGAGFDIVSGRTIQGAARRCDRRQDRIFGRGQDRGRSGVCARTGHPQLQLRIRTRAGIDRCARRAAGKKARIALRVNPDVDAETHPYISTGLKEHKFGIDIQEVEEIYQRARWHSHLILDSVSCHIGSQLLNPEPLVQALDRMLSLIDRLRAKGIAIEYLDLGGGLGVPYRPSETLLPSPITLPHSQQGGRPYLTLMVEPGRSLVAEARSA